MKTEEMARVLDEDFACPCCGAPLSLLRRMHAQTSELLIVVACEICEDYRGFVIRTGLTIGDPEIPDIERFIKPRSRPIRKGVRIEGLF